MRCLSSHLESKRETISTTNELPQGAFHGSTALFLTGYNQGQATNTAELNETTSRALKLLVKRLSSVSGTHSTWSGRDCKGSKASECTSELRSWGVPDVHSCKVALGKLIFLCSNTYPCGLCPFSLLTH